jgi:hypothetical protein
MLIELNDQTEVVNLLKDMWVTVTIVTIYNTIQVTSQKLGTEWKKYRLRHDRSLSLSRAAHLYTRFPLHIANAKSQSKRPVSFLMVFIISTHLHTRPSSHKRTSYIIRSIAARAHEDVTPTGATTTLPLRLLLGLLLLGHRRIAHLRHVEVHRPD